jgi:PIN domain nuclease of toxin-antitoxin system
MKYLLDTHAFLWYFDDSDKLSKTAANIIEDTRVQKYVSMASLWEFAIKYSMGKLQFDGGLPSLWDMISKNRFVVVPVVYSYLAETVDLPFIHRDPFDRLLVATAKTDGLTILTSDENIRKYDVLIEW